MRICLDAGHGGKDLGVSVNGVYEKDITLKICKYARFIAKKNGFECFMTREKDESLVNIDRALYANRNNCDIFVSIHCNSFVNELARGTETWSYPCSDEGEKLSHHIQGELIKSTSLFNRGCKKARFSVLNKTEMPAVLTEVAFLSNPQEAKLLVSSDFLWEVASSIVRGCCNYFKTEFKEIVSSEFLGEEERNLVLEFQKFLNSQCIYDESGYPLREDGILGQRTLSVLQKFEKILLKE
ncbi:N-acetylmuramoyl-L-alanine amidase family protein [Oceanirhabdus sp. W0125-5]|uniref:N-acetylmuramoyl-L-alanine amidase family protein n=1 Tax=Oceanirhabdus sp. W0125-5 TaxID=2999116 RepID=UPI0022F2D515|nr:N-acetylmuramoyl-L-alanine amidase [Oceanirhabdus sp. W0125-5]WBW97391.1 N-acetylmuramoyl-L-alanine amidase [Oceanirhabdus sp. W0125-5]